MRDLPASLDVPGRPAAVPPPAALRMRAEPVPAASRRPAPLMRRVEIAALRPDGSVDSGPRLLPALLPFEEPFAAFARGTVLATEHGPVAVEDLRPGQRLRTASGALRPILWWGATLIVPGAPGQSPEMTRLVRIAAGALGLARPEHDLVLGPLARVVLRRPGIREITGCPEATVPAIDLADGEGVIAIAPPAPAQVFGLCLAGPERLLADGIEIESYHPGPPAAFPLRGEALDLLLACFPGRADLAAFGPPALPRLRLGSTGLFEAA
ncbi:Hint domain-containing protein [Rubellimicrobium sp. CFH 75288]|uniref:Hint domain-containing protein n=1 Tax=Rubellimicrobium sp. CFH 75288 TaxID=2697034 RepID=UPI001FB74D5B|nr:Hint domain-containing protein [Rubellimicrobium sp. CFH 75288]